MRTHEHVPSSRAKVSLKVSAAVTFRKAQEGMSVLTVDREPGKLKSRMGEQAART